MMEVMISMVVLGLVFTSLYAGISSGFAAVNLARENYRATQILTEKMEEFRTFSWSQLSPTNIPMTFIAYFFPTNVSNATNSGVVYNGTITLSAPDFSETYTNNLKQVTVEVSWRSGSIDHQKQMTTLVSEYGMRNYIW